MKCTTRVLGAAFLLALCVGAGKAYSGPKINDKDCLACHAEPSFSTEVNGKAVDLHVDPARLKKSFHGRILGCVDCHTDVTSAVHETPPRKITCAQCHQKEVEVWERTPHSKPGKTGKAPAAGCEDCHGGAHEILTPGSPQSPVNHANIPATCGRCHAQKFLMESNGQSTKPFDSYQESVHGRAIGNGSSQAAVCTDCHSGHDILPASDQSSAISKFNVPRTCGRCHAGIAQEFNASIHGQAIARGNGLAPVCTDCHGIHSIKAHIDPSSSVSEQNVARTTCARCHEGVRLSQEFGIAGSRVTTYLDSYHGLASSGGSAVVANCASCHGVHNILPSSDPRSTINHANLDATCGQCHKGVTQKFTQTRVHLDKQATQDIGALATRWVRLIYVPLIVLMIGWMFAHNLIIWRSKTAKLRSMQNPMMVRMTPNQRWQHLILLTSFIVLVITGFALKFPTSWLAELLGMGEHLRSIVHRVAGVVLMGVSVYHVCYLIATREGRRLYLDLVGGPQDIFDAYRAMGYYLGLRKERPKSGRFTYAEKTEYWALVWGTMLMSLTGIMMWANVWVGNLLARWWVDVATSVHFYEAILASLAILVWHFYQVIFDPDVYPMNWAWWDGKMPVEHYRREHELDAGAAEDTTGASADGKGPAGRQE